ncbi:MAG: magnesium chelatase [Thermoproteota archaeon]|nr:MAG: magnesium chelatase [Candidatus Korarchaeota archaeon]RLG46259.1 MAG: magnesium chelatase [Candidatus Korarchaeota archaeon]
MKIEEVNRNATRMLEEISSVIVGKEDVLELLLACVLANGHVLIEDVPGLAKTMMARCLASVMACKFSRIQFTPDLLPADIIGTYVFNQKTGEFYLRKGPIFANIVLGDEINRAPPKTQSALLEAMQEKQVTIEGETHKLEEPFIVIATQNPIEYEGTYPLPAAQLDRFLVRLNIGYPDREEEIEILKRRISRKSDYFTLNPVVSAEEVVEMQRAVEDVHVEDSVLEYIVDLVRATREASETEVGSSPRGSLALLKLSRALAAIKGRDYVIPDDVKRVAIPALAHRLILRREFWYTNVTQESIVGRLLETVEVPKFV